MKKQKAVTFEVQKGPREGQGDMADAVLIEQGAITVSQFESAIYKQLQTFRIVLLLLFLQLIILSGGSLEQGPLIRKQFYSDIFRVKQKMNKCCCIPRLGVNDSFLF